MNSSPVPSIFRWHMKGVVSGTVISSLATLPLILMGSDHGSIVPMLWGLPAIWLVVFVLASPVLLGILVLWREFATRRPQFERQPTLRIVSLLLVASAIAILVHIGVSLYAAITDQDGFSLAHMQYRLTSDREMFGLELLAAVSWLVVPRLVRVASPLRSLA